MSDLLTAPMLIRELKAIACRRGLMERLDDLACSFAFHSRMGAETLFVMFVVSNQSGFVEIGPGALSWSLEDVARAYLAPALDLITMDRDRQFLYVECS